MTKKNIFTNLKFDDKGLIPVIVQDYKKNDVLMLAYMNKQALKLTLRERRNYFYSRTRNKLWLKGENSGHYQEVKEIYLDCDNDALLIKVKQIKDVACHTGNRSCFYKKVNLKGSKF